MNTQVYAHRGYSAKAMENSRTAFQMAKTARVDGIELDVQLTKDGEVVVIHDETLDRTTNGSGWVQQYTYKELSQFSLKTLPNETIPTLTDILEMFVDTTMQINIELKNQYVRYDGLAEKVIQLVECFKMEQRVILSSFYHPSLVQVKQMRPDWNIALLLKCALYHPWKYAADLGILQLHLHHSAVDKEVMTQCKQRGITVRTYTVNEEVEMARLIALGVDAIITNYPSKLRSMIEKDGDSVVE